MEIEKNIEIDYVPDEEGDETDPTKAIPNQDEKQREDESVSKKKRGAQKSHLKIHQLEETLQRVVEERSEFQDKYLRSLAEMDNFRKRILKEKEEYQRYVLSDFLLDLLQVYDNLDRALKAKNTENDRAIVSGVEIIRRQLLDLLKKYNVVEIDALGKRFNPSFHEALSKEERLGLEEPVVIEVYQKGFVYNEKLLRPALTKVAVPGEIKEESEKAES
jgi:molecular chaperone GrpE